MICFLEASAVAAVLLFFNNTHIERRWDTSYWVKFAWRLSNRRASPRYCTWFLLKLQVCDLQSWSSTYVNCFRPSYYIHMFNSKNSKRLIALSIQVRIGKNNFNNNPSTIQRGRGLTLLMAMLPLTFRRAFVSNVLRLQLGHGPILCAVL